MYAIQDGDQLYRSFDDGLNWQLVNTLPVKAGDAGGEASQTDTTQIILEKWKHIEAKTGVPVLQKSTVRPNT